MRERKHRASYLPHPAARRGDANTTTSSMKRALSSYRTKSSLVYEALRRTILTGRFEPGSRVNIDQLAIELGTSKVPIREAIGRLVGEGWLQMSPHVGAVVPRLSADEALETSIVRSVIEGAAVRFSAERIDSAGLQKLGSLLSRLDDAAAADSPEFPELNLLFHAAVFEACPFPVLKQAATSLLEKTSRLRAVRFLPRYLPQTQAQHHQLFQALKDGNGKTAEQITRRHIEQAGRLFWKFATSQVEKPPATRRSRLH